MMENELMSHLANEWGQRSPISWIRFNARPSGLKENFDFPKTTLVPNLRQLESDWIEYPALQSGRTYPYILFLNILTEPFSGKAELQGHLQRLREIFDLKDLIFSESHAIFEILNAGSGFFTDSGDKWEQPSSISFTAIL